MPYKTHKITLNPNNKQRTWLAQQCGYARFAYNQALSDFKVGLDQDTFQSWRTLNVNFNNTKKKYDWTRSQDLTCSVICDQEFGSSDYELG